MPTKFLVGYEEQVLDSRWRGRLALDLCDPKIREMAIMLSVHGLWAEIMPKWAYEEYYKQLWAKMSMETAFGFLNYANTKFLSSFRTALKSHQFVNMDDSQRIVIPQHIRESLNIVEGSTIVLVGMLTHVELWKKDVYDEYMQKSGNQDLSLVFNRVGLMAGGLGGDAGLDALSGDEAETGQV